ncbi:hypothetical protein [Streptomyces bambusae]|uniref:Uncharacterized protein n=1 Tax=Streptomyces bambusae TaxID=1550616 RepID=A0ABS6Z3F8_9ACTN|nr:hypothetical protein [Streptomyces bambusae]MBW5482303.1 hypothetical protein [Streptomyces bambusae]
MDDQLSSAIVLYFSDRRILVEERGRKLLLESFGPELGAELISQIDGMIERTFEIGEQFPTLSLDSAEAMVAEAMHREYPQLSSEVIAALAWYWGVGNF